MKPLVISFSGGRTSAYMTVKLLEKYKGKRDIHIVFANTGKEREETLKFVHDCDVNFGFNTVWIETEINPEFGKGGAVKIVSYETASRNGEPFEQVIAKYGIPNMATIHCTRELKTSPTLRYLKQIELKEYEQALGIRIDEPKRIKQRDNIIYPLVKEFPTTKKMVNAWWANQSFNLELKGYEGNCDLCWKKSKRKLLTLLVEKPELAVWWNEMEMKYGNYIPETHKDNPKLKLPVTFFRHNESMQDLIEDSKMPFKLATDDFTLQDLMYSQPELDFTNGCEESCEAF
jgi:hypothetical protein